MSDRGNFGGFSIARGRNRWGYKNPFLNPSKNISNENIVSLSADKITAGTMSAVTINGGSSFVDTLGTFYPIVVNASGNITVNASQNHIASLMFHNTNTAITDIALSASLNPAATYVQLGFIPNTTTQTNYEFVVADRSGQASVNQFSIQSSGGATGLGPEIIVRENNPNYGSVSWFLLDHASAGGGTYNLNGWPKMNVQLDTADMAHGGAGNGIFVGRAIAGVTPTIVSLGADANISLNIITKGTGTLQYNGTEIAKVGAPTLTSSSAALGSDVTMTNANTYYDGPTITLAAGTWLIIGTVTLSLPGNTTNVTAKLWDGTTVSASSEGAIVPGNGPASITLSGIVSPSGSTTYKLSAAATLAACIIKAATPDNAAGNTASTIRAVKISP